jgi:hypothetical protein
LALLADASCRLLEVDWSGIESVLVGYFLHHHQIDEASAAAYVRLSRLGLHAAVAAIKLGKPADLSWPDDELQEYLREVKHSDSLTYDTCKRVVHGTNYGVTPYGLAERFPDLFPSIKSAEETQQFLFALAPGLPKWHLAVRQHAKAVGFLGGLSPEGVPPSIWDHPFGYRHNFWDVLAYRPADEVTTRRWLKDPKMAGRIVYLHGRPFKVVWGGDSKRVIAYFPQSTGAGALKRAELRLFHPYASDLLGGDFDRDYIGDAYFGRTPLLHPIHDALLLHVPNRIFDRVAEIVIRVMQDGIPELPCPLAWGLGPTLRIGVEASAGRTWEKSSMPKIDVPPIVTGVVTKVDRPVLAPIENEEEEWSALARTVA